MREKVYLQFRTHSKLINWLARLTNRSNLVNCLRWFLFCQCQCQCQCHFQMRYATFFYFALNSQLILELILIQHDFLSILNAFHIRIYLLNSKRVKKKHELKLLLKIQLVLFKRLRKDLWRMLPAAWSRPVLKSTKQQLMLLYKDHSIKTIMMSIWAFQQNVYNVMFTFRLRFNFYEWKFVGTNSLD